LFREQQLDGASLLHDPGLTSDDVAVWAAPGSG